MEKGANNPKGGNKLRKSASVTVPMPNDTDSPDYESDHPLWSDSGYDSCSVATGTTDSTKASCEATSR